MPRADDTVPSRAPRRRRADAQRNYERLLTAAEQVFDKSGVDAPLDDVAREAGVGNATLYRHFPTRRDLIAAVCADEVTAVRTFGELLLDQDAPVDALFGWLRAFIAHVGSKPELASGLTAGPPHRGGLDTQPTSRASPPTPEPPSAAGPRGQFDTWRDAMLETATTLLSRAQVAGFVRADLDPADLLTLANGIALSGAVTDQLDRLLDLARHGATPPAEPPQPPTGPTVRTIKDSLRHISEELPI